ncbi:MAG: hypothetical protein R3217_07535 [Gammaproteobacteria bacterium]|nr:hypothetical protein [Gammaproteobacteria bacterium]
MKNLLQALMMVSMLAFSLSSQAGTPAPPDDVGTGKGGNLTSTSDSQSVGPDGDDIDPDDVGTGKNGNLTGSLLDWFF